MRIKTELITNYIKQQKTTKKAFCEKCNISLFVLAKILNNKLNFKSKHLFAICDVIGVLPQDIIDI